MRNHVVLAVDPPFAPRPQLAEQFGVSGVTVAHVDVPHVGPVAGGTVGLLAEVCVGNAELHD